MTFTVAIGFCRDRGSRERLVLSIQQNAFQIERKYKFLLLLLSDSSLSLLLPSLLLSVLPFSYSSSYGFCRDSAGTRGSRERLVLSALAEYIYE